MFRLMICFVYMCSYLIYSIPTLRKMKKLSTEIPVEERDQLIHQMPKKWSKTIMKLTGSEIKIKGEEHLPRGPVVFISNHEGDFDIPTLLGYIPKPFGFISKIEVKKVPVISSWMEVLKCVFLDRKDRRQAVRSIRQGTEYLRQGHSLVIFPEGTRSKGGEMNTFKSGSFRLAKDGEVPIVPICIQGTADVFEKNNRLIRPAQIEVKILPPVMAEDYKEKSIKEMAAEIEEMIRQELEADRKSILI